MRRVGGLRTTGGGGGGRGGCAGAVFVRQLRARHRSPDRLVSGIGRQKGLITFSAKFRLCLFDLMTPGILQRDKP